MRRDGREGLQVAAFELVDEARGRVIGLDGIDNDKSLVAYNQVQKSEAHFGTLCDRNGLLIRQAVTNFASDAQPDGVVGQQVVAQAKQEDWSEIRNPKVLADRHRIRNRSEIR